MKILNIPFISKPKAQIFTKAIAKYVFNDVGEIIDQWVEILEGTQIQGKPGYGAKFNKKYINFRKELMGDDSITVVLNKNQLEKINTYFFQNLNTVLNLNAYITGSNPSGSDYNLKRTPYLIYGGKYNQYMFINFFKTLKGKKDKQYLRRDDLEQIDLEKYFELFPKIKHSFDDFNKILFTALDSQEINDETFVIDNKFGNEIVELILSDNYKLDILDEKEKDDYRIGRLRRIFKNRLRNIKPTDHLFGELPEDMCEAAHIFPVSEIRKLEKKYWYMIADEDNGINLPIQFHRLYDSYKIFFNENGEIIFTNPEYKKHLSSMFSEEKQYKLVRNILNKERREYIKKYNFEVLNIK